VYYGLNGGWLLLIIFSTVLGLATQGYIKSSFRKWSQVDLVSGLTGAQVAEKVLAAEGLSGAGITTSGPGDRGVVVRPIGGDLSDNYDPRSKTLNLSEGVFGESTVAAAGVAAHEAGHAIQDARGYVWGNVRNTLVPIANLGSQAAFPLIFLGIILRALPFGQLAVWTGVLLFSGAVLFQVVTLPVELDASRRAMNALQSTGVLQGEQLAGARQVLTAAALTYVAAALVAIMQLLYFVGIARRN
jgi:uncharacterized protein